MILMCESGDCKTMTEACLFCKHCYCMTEEEAEQIEKGDKDNAESKV